MRTEWMGTSNDIFSFYLEEMPKQEYSVQVDPVTSLCRSNFEVEPIN